MQGFKNKEGLTEGLIGKRISSANKAIAVDEATAQISSLVQKALVGEITATELLT